MAGNRWIADRKLSEPAQAVAAFSLAKVGPQLEQLRRTIDFD